MTILPFPEYAPDVATLQQGVSAMIQNVLPQKNGYGPIPSPAVYSAALPAASRGFFRARAADGSVVIFAATSTRLFRLSNTDFTWVPVSKAIALTSITGNPGVAVFALNTHGLSIGDAIVLTTSNTLPTGLAVSTVYYVSTTSFGVNSFKVSDTLAHALARTNEITISSNGSGTHSFTGQYTAIPNADQWQFVQFNNLVFATQINTVLQVIDLTTLATISFIDALGSPPQARYISVVNRFLVLSGLSSSTPYRIQWSGLNSVNASSSWTSGIGQSDFQDLPDGGIVRGVGGGESGLIMQDSAIRRMIYAPGSAYIFQIERVSQDKGIYAPLSLVRAGDQIFYCGNEGFQMVQPGGYPQPIGKERVDRTFFADVDSGNLQLMLGAVEPRATRVYWAYKSVNSNAALFDKVLVYDYAINRWSLSIGISGEYLCNLARPSVTLEGLDAIFPNIDTASLSSLDDISTSTIEYIAAFDSSHRLNFITGTPLEATIDSAEQEMDGCARMRIQGLRPVTDASSCFGSVLHRENVQSAFVASTEQAVNGIGLCPANVSARVAKGRLRIPAGTVWTYATGFEPKVKNEGMR